jgi:hypothetical protein
MAELVDTIDKPQPPFDRDIHLKCPTPTDEQRQIIDEMRSIISKHELYENHKDWADDDQFMRFLIARNYNLSASVDLMIEALTWRDKRKPSEIHKKDGWEDRLGREGETGKIYCAHEYDKWGRSVVVFDNTVQNTNDMDGQMEFLAWNLEYAIKAMKSKNETDKYLVFMHLNNFSFFNMPSIATTRETIHMLCSCYPERLGHCIAYQPPMYFRTFFNTVKGFLDPKTAGKMVFIIGDVSDGSENDKTMKELIGDNWKILTGADQPVHKPGASPGYDHDNFWPAALERAKSFHNEDTVKIED